MFGGIVPVQAEVGLGAVHTQQPLLDSPASDSTSIVNQRFFTRLDNMRTGDVQPLFVRVSLHPR